MLRMKSTTLIDYLVDSPSGLKAPVMKALGKKKTREAIPQLVMYMHKQHDDNVALAHATLEEITGPKIAVTKSRGLDG